MFVWLYLLVDLQKKKSWFFFSILCDSWISVRYVLINMEYKWQNTKTVFSFDHKIFFFFIPKLSMFNRKPKLWLCLITKTSDKSNLLTAKSMNRPKIWKFSRLRLDECWVIEDLPQYASTVNCKFNTTEVVVLPGAISALDVHTSNNFHATQGNSVKTAVAPVAEQRYPYILHVTMQLPVLFSFHLTEKYK